MNIVRKLLVAGTTTLTLIAALAFPSAPVYASLACEGTAITINSGAGAEPPRTATGHRHSTGNHYVRYILSNRVWIWWADNNGGSDGDTADTYYGEKQC